jgi:hypothetical protein
MMICGTVGLLGSDLCESWYNNQHQYQQKLSQYLTVCIFGDKRETNKRKKGRKKGYNTILPNPSLISLVCVQVGLQVSSHLQICQRLGQERRLLGLKTTA